MALTNDEAREILQKEYHVDNLEYLLDDCLLPDYKKNKHDVLLTDGNAKVFSSICELGSSQKCDVVVFEVYLTEEFKNRRVKITQEMFKVLRSLRIDNALVAFVNPDGRNYRFSLLTSKYEYDGDTIKKVLSNPRRLSFSLGYNTKTKTAYDFLISKRKVNSLEELTSRFSVEVVNKEFYNQIAICFTKLVGGERFGKKYDRLLRIQSSVDDNKYTEFAVRLIGRIMFCWFLKEKKSEAGIALIPEEWLSIEKINSGTSYYHQVLEPLFFEMLNTPQRTRKDCFVEDENCRQVPYLNGGLFAPHHDDFYKFDFVSMSGRYGLIDIPDSWFIDFYQVLSEYNFTVDENTSYDIELSVDPEMLGRIFENLLAEINPETGENAKKSTGSFYTPRDIVDYMVDSSLQEYLKNKTGIEEDRLRELIKYNKLNEELAVFSIQEKKSIINALYGITILDPACGSGAFPIGMLQKIVFILEEIDEDANLWFDKATENVTYYLRKEFEKRFQSGSLDYIRKLCVIQNSIFGVDIQPSAVEISRLRCFLSLVIEEKVNDDEDNRGIKALPNLDFKIICANSLIPLSDEGKGSMFENPEHIKQLKDIRERYFDADTNEKNQLKYEFSQVQGDMKEYNIYTLSKVSASKRYEALFKWKPFDNDSSDWFDPEWMFGIKAGFDIVIGNPPYVSAVVGAQDNTNDREQLKKLYPELKGAFDLYVAFLCFGIKCLKEDGIYSWIIPNKFLVAKYASNAKTMLIKKGLKQTISVSDIRVFSNASVYPILLLGNKGQCYEYIEYTAKEIECLQNNIFDENNELDDVTTFSDYNIKFASGTTGFQAKEIMEYISNGKKDNGIPFVVSGSIDPYIIDNKKVRYMGNKYEYPYINKGEAIADSKWRFWLNPKIIIAGMTKRIEAIYIESPMALGVGVYAIYDFNGYNPKYITALLNSKYMTYYLKTKFYEKHLAGGYLAINKNILEMLPFVETDINSQVEMALLYDKMIIAIENDDKNEKIKSQRCIDEKVYQIYGLTPEEIAIVEESIK